MPKKTRQPNLIACQFVAIVLVVLALLMVVVTRMTPSEQPPACTLGSAEALFTDCQGH